MKTILHSAAVLAITAMAAAGFALSGQSAEPKEAAHGDMPEAVFKNYADLKWDKMLPDLGDASPEMCILQGKDRSKDFLDRFGLVIKSPPENGYNLTHTFRPFLAEAYRVLRKNGVLFCKLADYVHGHRYQWAHVEIVNAATEIGFMPCDCIVKIRKGPITDPRWKRPITRDGSIAIGLCSASRTSASSLTR